MRIALFGGSFDPPHVGHVLAATYAHAVARLDEVWVLPVDRHAYGKPVSPWDQRWRLCQAAFAGLGFVRMRDDERRNPDGFTVTLLERLRTDHPGNEWFLIGGTDTNNDLRNWHRGAELITLEQVIAVPRRGFDDANVAALPAISSSLIRERIGRGEAISGLVPEAVRGLIEREGWYRG